MEKKRAEGKTKTQALRGLKRLITRSVFRTMTSDRSADGPLNSGGGLT